MVTSAGCQERPLPKGEYKDTPNNPTSRLTGEVHGYAAPIEVPAEMNRLVHELRSPTYGAAHPVLQAAWAHYAFIAVHPFADGNGRVARALASVFLYRRPGVPLVIFADQKDAYLDGLEEADRGRPERFVRFVLGQVADVVGLAQVSAQNSSRPASASIAELRDVLLRVEHFPEGEATGIAKRLLDAVYADLRERMASLGLPDGVRMSVANTTPVAEAVARQGQSATPQLLIRLDADAPADTTVVSAVTVGVVWSDAIPSFRVRAVEPHPDCTVELREAFPTFSGVLDLKVQLWVERLVDRLVNQLAEQARTVLQQRGYL